MFNFYLLAFYLVYFPGNIYENSLSFAVSDIFAYIISGLLIKRLSIHSALIMPYMISALGGVLYLLFIK